jgi:diguanylate cyclase (GGDEF)-like protein
VDDRIRFALRGTGGDDPVLMSRVLGVLLLCGGLLAFVALVASPPEDANVAGLYSIGGVALGLGAASIVWGKRARSWTVHTMFAAGSGLVCLGIYFSGVATGAYAVLFVWLVVIAASFFSPRATAAQVAWILVASGLALGAVGEANGVSPLMRWTIGSMLLVIAAVVMSEVMAGRRATEELLRNEIDERTRLQRELEHLAHHDPLTGLANRRRLEHELTRELARADRQGTPLCVLALDLDGLKAYNDAHGHAGGDRLLKRAASVWSRGLRANDLLARMGGDEFVALLPDCRFDEARHVLQRLRDSDAQCTCSAGIACWDGDESGYELLSRADEAMYAAKAGLPAGEPRAGSPADPLATGR